MIAFQPRLALGASCLVLATMLATPALAASDDQAAPAADTQSPDAEAPGGGGQLSEIVVTAQKRRENLQETPIAISVLTSQGLADRHVTSLLDLGDGAIPSLKVAPFFSRPGALIVNIRGVGVLSDSNQPARDQGVGVYVDGVYMGRAQGLGTALFDVENIEVLKGPQGTLFGRNTMGGAVNIVTKKPSGQFKLNATAGAGNYGSYKGEVHVDLPEFANISLKVDGVIARRNPFVKNPMPGQLGFNSYDKHGVHVEALWKPVSNFSADLSYDNSYDATSTLYQQQISAPLGLPVSASGSAAVPANVLSPLLTLQPDRASTAVVGAPQQASVGKAEGGRLGLEYIATPNLTFRSITSYREMTQSQFDNGSVATSMQRPVSVTSFQNFAFGRYSLAPFRQNQFSQELQVIGEVPRLKYQAGGLYYQERVEDSAQAPNTLMFTNAAGTAYTICDQALVSSCRYVTQRASHVKTTSIGVYGQATYTPPVLEDMVHLTVGARWTRDKKEGSLFTINGAAPSIPVNGVNVVGPIALDRSWSRVDPLVNLAFDASRDLHFYGKWSTGYRSGGASSRSLTYRAFDPEKVSMFEIGAKTEFFDRHARFNIAAYTGTYKSIQLDFSGLYVDTVNGVPQITTRTTTDVVNAPGTGRLKGVEAELLLMPMDGLTLSASYAYNSVHIPPTVNPFPQTGGVPITTPVPIYQVYTPKHSASGSIDYEHEVTAGGAMLKLHLDGNYDSGFYVNYTDANYDNNTRAVRYPQVKGESGLVFNGRIALADIPMEANGAKVTVAVWARNLFNEQHLFYKTGSAAAGISGFFNDPRTWGAEINVKF